MGLSTPKDRITPGELTKFAFLGALMFLSKMAMQWLPNIHLLGMFLAAFTLTYRQKALIPLYVYVFLEGMFSGFALWWVPYLYIWLPLWGAFLLAGRLRLSEKVRLPLYMVLCGLHGLLFGVLYAPVQALFFRLSFQGTLAWIAAGLPFDMLHGMGNFLSGVLILPLHKLLVNLESGRYTRN